MPSVLVVDDDPSVARVLRQNLAPWGVDVIAAFGVRNAVDLLLKDRYQAIVLDLLLGDQSGFDVLDAMRQASIKAPIIVTAAKIPDYARILLQPQEVLTIMTKPFDIEIMTAVLLGLCGIHEDDDPTLRLKEARPPAP